MPSPAAVRRLEIRQTKPTFRTVDIAICNKCLRWDSGFLAKLKTNRVAQDAARRTKVKKIIQILAAMVLGVGLVSAARAHVSVGIGIGVPIAPAYPVYAAPPPPVYYAPGPVVYAPAPVVYAPLPVIVGGYYGHPYWRGGYYRGEYGYRGGYAGWRH